jgi:hypothetical protein
MQDTTDSMLWLEMTMEKEPGYDEWVVAKVTETMRRMDSGEEEMYTHEEVKRMMNERFRGKLSPVTI